MKRQICSAIFLASAMAITVSMPTNAEARGVTEARPIDSSVQCLPSSVLSGAEIVMLGQYGGKGTTVPYQIRGAAHGTRAVAVVGDPGRPIVLVLSAYESTIWDFSRVPAGRIKGVVASGFYAQGVIGLPASVPVAMRHRAADNGTDKDVDPTVCPDTNHAYKGPDARNAAQSIRTSLGRYPTEFFGAYDTAGYNLSGGAVPSYSDEPTGRLITERPVVRDGLRSGEEGLRQLVASGVLRPVVSSDVSAWQSQGAQFEPLNRTAGIMNSTGNGVPRMHRGGFLIAQDVTKLPGGLDGAHSTTFFVPEGVSAPYDMQTHSTFYKIKGLSGIPATSGAPMESIGFFPSMIPNRTIPGGTRLHHARWNPDGSLISETPGTVAHESSEPWMIGPLNNSPFVAQPENQPDIFSSEMHNPVAAENKDMTMSALVAALLLAFGTVGLIIFRKKAKNDPIDGRENKDSPETFAAETHGEDPEMAKLSQQLQQAIDVSHQDETALTLLRFKRMIERAVIQDEYDDDLLHELNHIVEDYMPEIVSIYLRAIKRVTGSKVDQIEESLRSGIHRLTKRIEEILDEQSSRDADKMRVQEGFLRNIHPDDPFGGKQ